MVDTNGGHPRRPRFRSPSQSGSSGVKRSTHLLGLGTDPSLGCADSSEGRFRTAATRLTMSKKNLKSRARERAAKTGESYATARRMLVRKLDAFSPEQVDDALEVLALAVVIVPEISVEVRSHEHVAVKVNEPDGAIPLLGPEARMKWRLTEDHATWYFDGWLEVMEAELESGKDDLDEWLRRRLGVRCESVEIVARDGRRVRVNLRVAHALPQLQQPTRILSRAIRIALLERWPQYVVDVVEGGLLPLLAPHVGHAFPSHQIYIREPRHVDPPKCHMEVRTEQQADGGKWCLVQVWTEDHEVLDRRLNLTDQQAITAICAEAVQSASGYLATPAERRAKLGKVSYFRFHADYETCHDVGAAGMFQVVTIEDEKGRELTGILGIEHGTHYSDGEELKRKIGRNLGLDTEAFELDEV